MGRIINVLSTSPFTWLAVGVTVFFSAAFFKWFSPPPIVGMMVVGVGLAMIFLWFLIFGRSETFRRFYMESKADDDISDIEKILEGCPRDFAERVRESITLIRKIMGEFKSSIFQEDLNRTIMRLTELSRNHLLLRSRFHHFGNDRQKKTMEGILKQQIESVENSLSALKAFSGHLTLIEVRPEAHGQMEDDLKSINQGLQEAIQEMKDEKIF